MKKLPIMPSKPENPIENIMKAASEIKRRENLALKEMFGPFIKQSFLIKMKEKISGTKEFNDLLYKVYDTFDFSQKRMLYGADNYNFDLCKFITVIHKNNTIYMDDASRAAIQEDIKYQNKLQEQVITFIALRKFGTNNLAKGSLEGYCPIVYIVNTINNYMLYCLNKSLDEKKLYNVKNTVFKIQILMKMLLKIEASVVLIDNQLVEESYNPLRSLVELLMIYLCLAEGDKNSIDKYTQYVNFGLAYQKTREIPEEVKKDFNDNVKNKNVNIIDYLNYGWLDQVLEFCYIEKSERSYKLKDLVEILNMKYEMTTKVKIGSNLYSIYRECNPMSHGFNIAIPTYTAKMDNCLYLASIIRFIMPEIKKLCDISYHINNIKLEGLLEEIINDTSTIMKKIKADKELLELVNKPYLRVLK